MQADSLKKLLADAVAANLTFDRLIEGFMGLGLIVGVAALGVITARAVVGTALGLAVAYNVISDSRRTRWRRRSSRRGVPRVSIRRRRCATSDDAAVTGPRSGIDEPLTDEQNHVTDAYWRAANYLSVGQIYLLDNPLLREPLRRSTSSRACSATGARRRD